MKSLEEIYDELNGLIWENRWEEIEPYLEARMEEAKEEEAYGLYVAAGNELLSFYRQSGQYDKAFAVSEDILLLMEELNLEDTEHFALVLMSTGAAYEGAGRKKEAERCYERAARILEGKKKEEGLLAEALTRQALLILSDEKEAERAEELLSRAAALYEENGKDRTDGEKDPSEGQAEVYYLTALSGLGEAAWRRGDWERALACYEKAAEKSFALTGASEGTRLFWKNCAAVCANLKDAEKEAHYRALAGGNAS
ncbi:MAG TPA: tetratricopeptide repeat protein [Candidatus Eisenbergiella merdipullorum]|uniref:Tetratricopeptide repeat protein n=1 Tax=Candidatus Eisenbergiella merdipullorum TaxID=2838553 RepID=A0A9D2I6V1_9FIRM|nr:tetratricopeptide repeat protein [Candidatus Eisenbergiella merdipullorum]